jgi:D-proline reductase (dithiol) PrdB
VSLVARVLEEAGIVTVVIGSARDIVEYCGVPRLLYTDFPLGNPCGPPWDQTTQLDIAELAVDLVKTATAPRRTLLAPYQWPGNPNWRLRYNYVGPENRDQLKAIGEARQRQQAVGKL